MLQNPHKSAKPTTYSETRQIWRFVLSRQVLSRQVAPRVKSLESLASLGFDGRLASRSPTFGLARPSTSQNPENVWPRATNSLVKPRASRVSRDFWGNCEHLFAKKITQNKTVRKISGNSGFYEALGPSGPKPRKTQSFQRFTGSICFSKKMCKQTPKHKESTRSGP